MHKSGIFIFWGGGEEERVKERRGGKGQGELDGELAFLELPSSLTLLFLCLYIHCCMEPLLTSSSFRPFTHTAREYLGEGGIHSTEGPHLPIFFFFATYNLCASVLQDVSKSYPLVAGFEKTHRPLNGRG